MGQFLEIYTNFKTNQLFPTKTTLAFLFIFPLSVIFVFLHRIYIVEGTEYMFY